MGHIGMRYSLPSRELIADAAETVINAHWFDGVFYIPNCDKITPGMILAAMRTNVPAVFCSGGPMKGGVDMTGHQATLSSLFEAVGTYQLVIWAWMNWISWKKCLSNLWLLLWYVYRQFHELFDGSIRPCSSWEMVPS